MCGGCWEEYLEKFGAPSDISPEIAEAVTAIRDVYGLHCTGGAMHVSIEDWNLADDIIEWCRSQFMDDTERRCGEILAGLSERQRATALAIYDGYLVP